MSRKRLKDHKDHEHRDHVMTHATNSGLWAEIGFCSCCLKIPQNSDRVAPMMIIVIWIDLNLLYH